MILIAAVAADEDRMNELTIDEQKLMSVLGAEHLSVIDPKDIVSDGERTYPLASLLSLGSAFSQVASVITSAANVYEAAFPVVGPLDLLKDVGTGVSSIFMALALMSINKSLVEIADNQKAIITFLEVDKQTQLKGDLTVLSDIITDYLHNWNNPRFRTNREMQVLDIKRSAEQNILFYREMIKKDLAQKRFIRLDTNRALNEIQNKFNYYQLAVYLYSFSSFMGVMLLGNFEASYLDSISEKIRGCAEEYTQFREESLESIGEITGSSIQSRVLEGLSVSGKFIGKTLSRIPDKEGRFKFPGQLMNASDKIRTVEKEAIEKTKTEFSAADVHGITLFADKIDLVRKLYNEPLTICFDRENIYLKDS